VSSHLIRTARPDDAAPIIELWRASGAVPSRTDDEESIRALIRHDPEALLVAEVEGRLIGSLIAGFDGWRGSIFRAAVLPEYRRSGIGTALVTEGERNLRERGARRITLYAIRSEPGATEFWSALGFAEDGDRTSRFVKNLA
jgi:ribosomal protein S18 acetylase RimI-like enzyme